jgi:hypothetical protein
MKYEFLTHLENIFIEINEIRQDIYMQSPHLEGVQATAKRACHLYCCPYSDLMLFNSKSSTTLIDDYFSLAAEIYNLIKKHKLFDTFSLIPDDKYDAFFINNGSLLLAAKKIISNMPIVDLSVLDIHESVQGNSPRDQKQDDKKDENYGTDVYLRTLKKIESITAYEEIRSLTHSFLDSVCKSINIYLYEVIRKTIVSKQSSSPSKYVLDYVQKWIDLSVKRTDINKNSTVNYWDIIYDMDLSFEKIEEIEVFQSVLFENEVEREVRSLVEDFNDIKDSNKASALELQKKLLDRFVSGDIDDILIARVHQIIPIPNHIQILLKYDKILRNEYFEPSIKTIFNHSFYRQKSPVFLAHVLFEYLQYLKNTVIKKPTRNSKSQEKKRNSERKSFGFIGNVEALRDVLYQLADKVDLLHDKLDLESLMSLMTTDDYRNENYEIQLGCETIQFAYITGRLNPFFKQIKPIDIQSSKAFRSKHDYKKIILARDLHGKQDADVKSREEIDKIISYLK